MKLKLSELRQIIREEIGALNETIVDTSAMENDIEGLVQTFTDQMYELFREMHQDPSEDEEDEWQMQVGQVAANLEVKIKRVVEEAEREIAGHGPSSPGPAWKLPHLRQDPMGRGEEESDIRKIARATSPYREE